jgi:hypothetical protein
VRRPGGLRGIPSAPTGKRGLVHELGPASGRTPRRPRGYSEACQSEITESRSRGGLARSHAAQAATEPAGFRRRVRLMPWSLVCEEGWPARSCARSDGHGAGGRASPSRGTRIPHENSKSGGATGPSSLTQTQQTGNPNRANVSRTIKGRRGEVGRQLTGPADRKAGSWSHGRERAAGWGWTEPMPRGLVSDGSPGQKPGARGGDRRSGKQGDGRRGAKVRAWSKRRTIPGSLGRHWRRD